MSRRCVVGVGQQVGITIDSPWLSLGEYRKKIRSAVHNIPVANAKEISLSLFEARKK